MAVPRDVPTVIDLNPLHGLPVEVCDMVFHHLSGKELLTTSEVSPEFYNFIGNSRRCMSKIKIDLKRLQPVMKEDNCYVLVESCRRYQNFELSKFPNLNTARAILLKSETPWKNVVLRNIDFETVSEATEFIAVFVESVEELFMDQIYIRTILRQQHVEKLNLSNLKVLEIKCCQALLFHEVFVNCKKLVRLTIKSGSEISSSALEAIKKILHSNSDLKNLGIHFTVFNLIFAEDVAERTRFHLDEFHATDLYALGCVGDVRVNLQRFLHAQMKHLKVISLGEWMGIDVMKLILSMPCLRKVTLRRIHNAEQTIEWDEINLPRNTSLNELNFSDVSSSNEVLKKILFAVTNLNSLSIHSMDQASMTLISDMCPNLASLSIEYFQVDDVSEKSLFKKLQQFSFKKFKRNLKIANDSCLSNFEKLVADSINKIYS